MRFVAGILLVEAASASVERLLGEPAARATFERLLTASELLNDDGKVWLSAADLRTALEDMHLQKEISTPEPSLVHPSTLLPPYFYENESVDVTSLVCNELPLVLEAHPSFAFMVEQTLGNERFHESVYFGIVPRDEHSLSFSALCRRLVASIVLFEALLAFDLDGHRLIARWYEALYARAVERQKASTAGRSRPRSARDALMGFFLALKGESVLASINAFEELRRLSARDGATGAALAVLSDVLNDIMRLNICEAVLSNLSFAYWPDNARAGMALLLAPLGRFRPDLTQEADLEWMRLYLAWNANFIWPSHYCPDMMCFTMLAMPSIALSSPEAFQYRRAHSLFWVLTRLFGADERVARAGAFGVSEAELRKPISVQQVPCFRCRQLEPSDDRQPLTSRTARLTRAEGECFARARGEDVSENSGVWRRLAFEVVPRQLASLTRIYQRMPKLGPTKLKLL